MQKIYESLHKIRLQANRIKYETNHEAGDAILKLVDTVVDELSFYLDKTQNG